MFKKGFYIGELNLIKQTTDSNYFRRQYFRGF